MATSFISISSEAGWPDNPIKRLVWLRAGWANTGLFQLSVCLSVYVEISMSLCQCAMVYSQSPMVLRAQCKVSQTRNDFKFVDIFSSRNRRFYTLSHNYTIVYSDLVDK